MMNWKVISNYDKYEISDTGIVRRCKNKKVLKYNKTKGGYLRVTLYKNGKSKHLSVHRLVAYHFIPNPNFLPEVNHKDNNPINNNVDNLEWCTTQYNSRYSKSKPVVQYTSKNNYIKIWWCIKQVEEELGIDRSSISRCCKGTQKTAGGYIWKYLER